MSPSLLELRGVRVGPPDAPRLVVPDLSVVAGERIALIGANGSGKTTLLRVAGGWVAPDEGDVHVDGVPLASIGRRAAARRIAAILADEEAPPGARVRDVVALGRHPWGGRLGASRREDLDHVARAIDAADLAAYADRPVATLSSGERQRVALARALAQDAALMLVDEAAAHLDLARREALLARLADESTTRGRAIVAVLHDLDLAAAWADRAVVLRDGEIAAAGPAHAILRAETLGPILGVDLIDVATERGGPPRLLVARRAPLR